MTTDQAPPSPQSGMAPAGSPTGRRSFLMLQGPLSPLYAQVADRLKEAGHAVCRINLSIGDKLHWRRGGAIDFRGRPDAFPAFVENVIVGRGVSDVVLHGECRLYHEIAAAAARRHGARVFVTELGYLRPDWITVDRDGTAAASRFPRTPDAITAIAQRSDPVDLTPRYPSHFAWVATPDVVYNMANSLLWFLYPHYRRHTIDWPPLEYAAWLARLATTRRRDRAARRTIDALAGGNRPFFLFALQLEGDFQVRARSPFSSQAEALELATTSFSAHAPADSCLVVKTHPLDNGIRRWHPVLQKLRHRSGLGDRLRLADGGRLDEMLAHARGLVTINSSAGLEAILLGRPAKPMAPAIWDVEGLVHGGTLDSFWTAPARPDAGLAASFVRALAGSVLVRGTIYSREGLAAATGNVAAAILSDRPGRMTAPEALTGAAPPRPPEKQS